MNKKYVSRMIWMTLVGAAFCAFQLPSLLYGKPPETIDGTIQPRFTYTAVPPEVLLTQQAFAMMFFTPTYTPEPTRQPFLAFLLPITGPTKTFTPTASITYTATLSATPTRTLLPFFQTQTRVNEEGGGGGGGGGNTFTPNPFRTSTPNNTLTPFRTSTSNVTLTPFRTSTPNITLTVISTFTLVPSATDEPPATLSPTVELPIETPTDIPTRTPRRPPTRTPEPPPTATDEPPPTVTDEPPPTVTDEPPPTATDVPLDTPVPPPDPGGNSSPDGPATSSRYLMQFILMYVLGATFLGVVFQRR